MCGCVGCGDTLRPVQILLLPLVRCGCGCVSPSGSCAAGLVLSVARLQGVGPLLQGGQIVGALPWWGDAH